MMDKKLKMSFLMILFVSVSLFTYNVYAQCAQFQWPEDRSTAEEKVALYDDALKQKHYDEAKSPFLWMLNHAPKWHVKLYIDGANIYNNLAKMEKELGRKKELVDSLLMLYDMRLKNCGGKITVLNRKAFASYKYNINNKEKVADLMKLYDKVLEESDVKMNKGNLVAYMTVVKANRLLLKNMSDEEILQRYDKIMIVLDKKLKEAREKNNEKDIAKFLRYKDIIDGILVDLVKVDCDFVRSNLLPKFKKSPNDMGLAKKIFGFMLQDKCTDDPLWLEAGEVIHKKEKDYGLAKNLGIKYMSTGNYQRAEELLLEALELAGDGAEKSDIYTNLGSLCVEQGDKIKAKKYFMQSCKSSPSAKKGYEKIGDMYYNSFQRCSKKASVAQDRLIYIAAYEMYKRSGNAKKMKQAKAQFPSKEEIFLFNWKAGDILKIDCWFNETVTLATRD